MSGPCSMCQHFSMPDGLDAKLRAAGWGVCALGSDIAGLYQSQAAACQFDPPQFKPQPVVEGDERTAPADELPEEIDFG